MTDTDFTPTEPPTSSTRPARTGALLVTAALFTIGLGALAWPWIDASWSGNEPVALVEVRDSAGRHFDVMVFVDPSRGMVQTRSLIPRTGLWPDGRRLVLWTRHGLWWRKSFAVCDAPRGKPVLIHGEGDERGTIFVNAPVKDLRSKLEIRDGLARTREPIVLETLIQPRVPMRPPSVPIGIDAETVRVIEEQLESEGMADELRKLHETQRSPETTIR